MKIEKIYPLTPLQQGMLHNTLVRSADKPYYAQLTFEIEGEIDIDLLEKAFNILIERYEPLRTIFKFRDMERPLQVVLEKRETKLSFYDFSFKSDSEKEFLFEGLKEKDQEKYFDLERDIPVRITLLKFAPDLHRIIFSHHHIVLDGWSMQHIIQDIFQLYFGLYRSGSEVKLPEIVPFERYIRQIENSSIDEAREYWLNYLDGYSHSYSVLKNVSGIIENKVQKELCCKIDQDCFNRLNRIAKDNQVTLSNIFQLSWGLVLHTIEKTNDIVLGAVVSGRAIDLENADNIVGLCINTIPRRIKVNSSESFYQAVKRLNQDSIDCKSFEYFPLHELEKANGRKSQELINHVFLFENYPLSDVTSKIEDENLRIKNVQSTEKTHYNLDVVVSQNPYPSLRLVYNSELYDDELVKHFSSQLIETLNQVSLDINIPIKEIYERSSTINKTIRSSQNAPHQSTPIKTGKEHFIKALNEFSENYPENICLVSGGASYASKMVNEKSDAIRGWLKQNVQSGAGNARIAIFLHEQIDQLAAILGVLKAGMTFIVFDKNSGEERINYILNDSRPEVIITDSETNSMVLLIEGNNPVSIVEIYKNDSGNVNSISLSTSNIAYILYTSGTTGNPKGVCVSYTSISYFIQNYISAINLKENDKIAVFSTFAHSAVLLDVLASLLSGSTLYAYDTTKTNSLNELPDWVQENKITIWHSTPTFFRALFANDKVTLCYDTIRMLILGGEPVLLSDYYRFKEYFNDNSQFVNFYGATEIPIGTFNFLDKQSNLALGMPSIPIGSPIEGVRFNIVNEHNEEASIYERGEIVVESEYASVGYVNGNNNTASIETFGNGNTQPQRYYYTNDIGMVLEDGSIYYWGRKNDQILINGYLIDLNEIMFVAEKIKELKRPYVTEHSGKLVLYYTLQPNSSISSSDIHKYLMKRLNSYQVPSYYVLIDEFPYLPSKKVDIKSLPIPDFNTMFNDEFLSPANALEKELRDILASFTGYSSEQLSCNYPLFSLGLDSLKANVVVNRLNKEFGIELGLKEFYELDTIVDLAELITIYLSDEADLEELISKAENYRSN